jgi:hypothetical protein
MKTTELQNTEDMQFLSDLIQEVLVEWADETDAKERDIEINTVPFVLKNILASHYVHFFKTDNETVERYLDVLRKMIKAYKVNDINQEFDIDSNKNEAQA